jgi:hypothetical protein
MLKQSTPYKGDFSFIYLAFTYETVSNGTSPELSARAIGIYSRALAKALTAY